MWQTSEVERNFVLRGLLQGFEIMKDDKSILFYFMIVFSVLVMAAIGPYFIPYGYDEIIYDNEGDILRSEPPSFEHPLGTTATGYDVLSRLVFGARPTAITGILGGSIIISIGLSVGVTAGYLGGRTEDILMRITDVFYGIPLLPFAIVLIGLFDIGFLSSIVVIGILLWRGSARVIRSQVIQIKERPYILSAKTMGASDFRIIVKHILPNIAPMAMLFFAVGLGYSIIVQAGLAFLGLTDPFIPSWGVMIRNAFRANAISDWWWSFPPGIMISLTVLSAFMFGRKFERTESGDALTEA